MLYLLTGDIQIGKTRWLESLLGALMSCGVVGYGVLAPGVWVPTGNSNGLDGSDGASFEKLGIDNVLLPDARRIRFACREDLAQRDGEFDARSQAAQAHLKWHISDSAIAEVNEHLASIPERVAKECGRGDAAARKGVIVIDELGPLELVRGGGIVEGVRLMEAGSSDGVDCAVLVVRKSLADLAEERFSKAWGAAMRILPDDDGALAIASGLGVSL